MYAYCSNNPIMYRDDTGAFFETIWDVASLTFSIVEVVDDPSDPWNWAALGGDLLDVLIPCVGGIGESIKAFSTVNKIVDAADDAYDTYKAVDNAYDTLKFSEGTRDISRATIRYGDEIKLPKQIKSNEAVDAWNAFLGSNQTNFNKFTGKYEMDRIFSADGTKSIRFGGHEMNSLGTPKAHFHYEIWDHNLNTNTVNVTNYLQRLK